MHRGVAPTPGPRLSAELVPHFRLYEGGLAHQPLKLTQNALAKPRRLQDVMHDTMICPWERFQHRSRSGRRSVPRQRPNERRNPSEGRPTKQQVESKDRPGISLIAAQVRRQEIDHRPHCEQQQPGDHRSLVHDRLGRKDSTGKPVPERVNR